MRKVSIWARTITLIILDAIEAVGLAICSFLARPFILLQKLTKRSDWYAALLYLVPRGLFATLIRGHGEERHGNYDRAERIYQYILGIIEPELGRNAEKSRLGVETIRLIYTQLLRVQILRGHVEAATATTIRACRFLGIDRLPDFQDFDSRTAHIVKAGLAASKLLDDGGLATMFVKQGENPVVSRGRPDMPPNPPKPPKRGNPVIRRRDVPPRSHGAKIIPFPSRH